MKDIFLQATSVAKLKISKFSGKISKLTYKLCFACFEINESYFNFVAASITELKE